jgi:hypothetical protein
VTPTANDRNTASRQGQKPTRIPKDQTGRPSSLRLCENLAACQARLLLSTELEVFTEARLRTVVPKQAVTCVAIFDFLWCRIEGDFNQFAEFRWSKEFIIEFGISADEIVSTDLKRLKSICFWGIVEWIGSEKHLCDSSHLLSYGVITHCSIVSQNMQSSLGSFSPIVP